MRKLTEQEYQHVKDWMRKHEYADELVFDEETKLPLQAIYHCPLGTFVKHQKETIREILDKMDERISEMEVL